MHVADSNKGILTIKFFILSRLGKKGKNIESRAASSHSHIHEFKLTQLQWWPQILFFEYVGSRDQTKDFRLVRSSQWRLLTPSILRLGVENVCDLYEISMVDLFLCNFLFYNASRVNRCLHYVLENYVQLLESRNRSDKKIFVVHTIFASDPADGIERGNESNTGKYQSKCRPNSSTFHDVLINSIYA